MAELTDEQTGDASYARGLGSTINLTQVSWNSILWIVLFAVGSALRLFQLGLSSLSVPEARKAFDAWSLVHGATVGTYQEPSKVEPTGLLLRSFFFFLFGDSDTTTRITSALIGIGLIALIWSIRDLLGEWRALGAGALVALSPTAVYASRTANDEIIGLFFGLAFVIGLFRIGQSDRSPGMGRALLLGFSLAALIGSGPSSIMLLLVLVVTLGVAPFVSSDRGATVGRGLNRVLTQRDLLIGAVAGFVLTLFILFTRFFSDVGSISGIGEVFADWGSLIASEQGDVSTQFFILSILLYEIIAIIFAFRASLSVAKSDDANRVIDWSYPAVWFLSSLVLFSFSSGRGPEHAVLVTFPLLILGGFGLGDTIEALARPGEFRRRLGLLALAVAGVTIALVSTLILIGRVDTAVDRNDALVQVFAAAVIALGPLVVLAYTMGDQLGRKIGWGSVRSAALIGVTAVLTLLLIRSTVELSFYRQSSGVELLAQQTSVKDLRGITKRIANLSRDINGTERSPANPEGGQMMSIAVDRTVQWPFRWYFRDFPNLTITAPGQATTIDAQLVIAPNVTGMTEAGYQPRTVERSTNIAPAHLDPSLGTVLKHVFVPSYWDEGFQFLLYRKSVEPAAASTVIFGYSGPVVAEMTGERPTYQLTDRAGPGSNPGQFNQPRGVAVSPDGTRIYILDTQNARIQVFSDAGELLGIWGDGDDPVSLMLTDNGLGPYGIAAGADGLIYVADTWNHRIVVIDQDGQVVRTFGEFGNNEDAVDPMLNTATFYGPRGIVLHNNEIYVTDTGNERVQVFGLDGAFKRAWGGTGSGPDQLLEPVGITVGSDGDVYVADSGNARISVFDVNGAAIEQWRVTSWAGTQFYEPYLTADSDGIIYASDPNSAAILVFDLTGSVLGTITDADGDRLAQPAGMSISPTNQLYIADRGASEIYTLDLEPGTTDDGENVTDLPEGLNGSPVASPEASPAASPVSAG